MTLVFSGLKIKINPSIIAKNPRNMEIQNAIELFLSCLPLYSLSMNKISLFSGSKWV
jgi:hypothetical protein